MSDSSDEDLVTVGKALPPYDEDEVPKKPFHLQQQRVTDSKGRQRFHGAFTGGFSAGFYNTVGSKEGWTPSAYVSSREKTEDAPGDPQQQPEDFMDDEDLGEHGIAPRNISVANDFQQGDRKRKDMTTPHTTGVIPGEAPLQDLIVPSRIPMGIQLLRKLGWKEGQGIGPRVKCRKQRQRKNATGKKVYGCALPQMDDSDSEASDDEFAPRNVTFAPKDINPIKFRPKDDVHGLGYSGINAHSALGGRGHINLFEPVAPTPAVSSTGKRGMAGSAFGVGAMEDDDDDDVYATDSMSNYDRVLTDNTEKTFGWTAPKHHGMSVAPVGYLGKVLEGFKLSSSTLKPKQVFAPPKLPRDFKPHRERKTPAMQPENHTTQATLSERTNQRPDRKKMNATVRKAMLGELGSVFELVSDRDQQRIEAVKQEPQLSATSPAIPSTSHERTGASSMEVVTSRPSFEEQRKENMPLNRGSTGFKPFSKDPAKQQRYETYLEMKNQGVKYEPEVGGRTEWERDKEREDFIRAALLYRPLSNMMASRFTSAKYADDVKNVDMTPATEKQDERKMAVEMKMFGKLTRERYEWHPDKMLCKRFNIANPYPECMVPGVPGGTRKDKFDAINFFDESVGKEEDVNNELSPVIPVKQERADIKPLAILASDDSQLQSVNTPSRSSERTTESSTYHIDLTEDLDNVSVKEEEKERPPMDLFNAIFSNSEDSSESSSEEIEDAAASMQTQARDSSSVAALQEKRAYSVSDQQTAVIQSGTIAIESLEDRLSPQLAQTHDVETGNNDAMVSTHAATYSYGPTLPPSFQSSSVRNEENSTRKEKRKHKSKDRHKEKHKDKKKKSKHKKLKHKDKKKKKDRKKIIVISSSSGSEADEDTDSEPNIQPSDAELLRKLKGHSSLKRMTAADFM